MANGGQIRAKARSRIIDKGKAAILEPPIDVVVIVAIPISLCHQVFGCTKCFHSTVHGPQLGSLDMMLTADRLIPRHFISGTAQSFA